MAFTKASLGIDGIADVQVYAIFEEHSFRINNQNALNNVRYSSLEKGSSFRRIGVNPHLLVKVFNEPAAWL
jgi:hypothetical protein